jgi:hypothetical protein
MQTAGWGGGTRFVGVSQFPHFLDRHRTLIGPRRILADLRSVEGLIGRSRPGSHRDPDRRIVADAIGFCDGSWNVFIVK